MLAGESGSQLLQLDRTGVSIHARHCWRANPRYPRPRCKSARFQSTPAIAGGRIWRSSAASAPVPSFNPRPPLLAGESEAAYEASGDGRVSIHARHCWRANPTGASGKELEALFQSTPAIAGGRIGARATRASNRGCFNPRPPLLAGESGSNPYRGMSLLVSIHARHCWRANRWCFDGCCNTNQVSIHARHCWRANLCQRPGLGPGWPFQSTPAIAGGRIHEPAGNGPRQPCFNPRPPLLAGESLRM